MEIDFYVHSITWTFTYNLFFCCIFFCYLNEEPFDFAYSVMILQYAKKEKKEKEKKKRPSIAYVFGADLAE